MLRHGGALILPLSLAAAALIGGTIATYSYDRDSSLTWRLPAGLCSGLAALGFVGFWLAMRFGLQPWVVAAAGAAVTSPAALLLLERHRLLFRRDLRRATRLGPAVMYLRRGRTALVAVAYLLGLLLLWHVASRTMMTRHDGIYTGVSHNIGDLPFHLNATARFAYGDNFPPEHPSFAGVSFTYPFLTDFVAAMFVRVGLSIEGVMVWSTLLLCLALAALLYRWTLDLTGSRRAACLAPWLALMSGGLGWLMFFHEAGEAGLWPTLTRLPHDYTITRDGVFRWGNLVTTLLVTQRGLLLGLPLAIVIFHGFWQTMFSPRNEHSARQAWMIAAGVIAGLLPLVHAHTYAVVMGIAACFVLLTRDWRLWAPFFAWSLALGLPQVWWMGRSSAANAGEVISWAFGWDRGEQNVVVFWLRNTGLVIPLLAVALLWRGPRPIVERRLLLFYLPFTFCFIFPNLVRLAPWVWDNIKVLVYWFVASVPIVALLLARLAERGWWRRSLAVLLTMALVLAGALDLWRVASGAFNARIFDQRGIEFAQMVAARTGPRALILHAPMPNHPIALTGRRSLMGYPGHVWSHGLDYRPREADIRRIYAGGADAARLLAHYGIDYVVIGPPERAQMPVSESFFEQYPRIGEVSGYQLYRTTRNGD